VLLRGQGGVLRWQGGVLKWQGTWVIVLPLLQVLIANSGHWGAVLA